ncbi:MAG: hypothetical protein JWM40_2216, partial [Frankiales bacterium]|nr:hypothetical protein [Frankiales bacterium]
MLHSAGVTTKGVPLRKISTALATVGLAATALAGLGSTPAAANPACASYPPGSLYSLDISPNSTS